MLCLLKHTQHVSKLTVPVDTIWSDGYRIPAYGSPHHVASSVIRRNSVLKLIKEEWKSGFRWNNIASSLNRHRRRISIHEPDRSTVMKLKSLPEDFCVEEVSALKPSQGRFALYRLEKIGLGTPEAIQSILNKWELPRKSVSYGGMKDRHAKTTQLLTLFKGPKASLSDRSFSLHYLGQCDRPMTAKDIEANRFRIQLRNIQPTEKESLTRRCELIIQSGVANYFDDQRFGSIGYSGELIAVPWCLGNYERALYLAMAEPNSHDRPREKEQKQILRELWGNWDACKARLDRSHRRSIVTYLCDHPTDFKRALALVRQDLRGIYVACLQSWVWNRWLSRLIELHSENTQRDVLESVCGPLVIPLDPRTIRIGIHALQEMELPLPSARQHDWPEGTLDSLEQVLKSIELETRSMRLKYPRDTFFSRGMRPAWLIPKNMGFEWTSDDRNSGKLCLGLCFDLPRGSYATMVVRYLSVQWSNLPDLDSLE